MDSPLSVRVVNGNLKFVRQAMMIGHYRSAGLSGAERVVDTLLGGAMQTALSLGSYPEGPGDSKVFVNHVLNGANPLQQPRPSAVIVVGLGEEGELDGKALTTAVCDGAIAWAERLWETPGHVAEPFEVAATLIGSGGLKVGVGQSALLIVEGIQQANKRLAKLARSGVKRLHMVELYLDRASEAWCALRDQAAVAGGFILDRSIDPGVGALRRPLDVSYRGADYDLISATQEGHDGSYAIGYAVSTRRARTEVRAQSAQYSLLRDLVTREDEPGIGRTLFRLLVPRELQPFLTASSQAVIELDPRTAAIPWELLDAGDEDHPETVPWAIGAKLLRKLRTRDGVSQVAAASGEAHVLVIGEPACDEKLYQRIPDATLEATTVAALLERSAAVGQARVRALTRSDPSHPGWSSVEVVKALVERAWRIVHIAGHGELPEWLGREDGSGGAAPVRDGDPRGVVLSGGTFLGQREFGQMPKVPDLVFVNCCYLAASGAGQLAGAAGPEGRYRKARFAASLAESLIGLGVRCVVAAGWAVEDEPATAFATRFYESLVAGARFVDAVAAARRAAREKGGNTWAAYQCYGDPDWTLAPSGQGFAAATAPEQMFAQVASAPALAVALETLAVNARHDDERRALLPAALTYLEKELAPRWAGVGAVAEGFGLAWAECDRSRAIEWYHRALTANDGTASLRAAEQLGDLRARRGLDTVTSAWSSNGAAASEAARQEALAKGRVDITAALALLEGVAKMQPTIERESLCGAAWKRLALLEALAGRPEQERAAIVAMRARYRSAEALARENNHPELFQPAQNGMAAELIVDAGGPDWLPFDERRVAAVRASLAAKILQDPDFWSVAGLTELRVFEAMARGELTAARAAIEAEYTGLKARVGSPLLWAALRDQLNFVLSRSPALRAEDRPAAQGLLDLLQGFAAA